MSSKNVVQTIIEERQAKEPWRVPILFPSGRLTRDRQGYLAAVAIAKDEETDLREWLEFHRLIGFKHVYLYDNGSSDNSLNILNKFVERGYVTVIPWANFIEGGSPQRAAYAHAVCNFGPDWRWMAFLDLDEYLFPTEGNNLPQLMKVYEDLPAIAVYWHMFGSSGHEHRPPGLVIENFTLRAPFPPEPSVKTRLLRWKSIINPSRVHGIESPHSFILDDGVIGAYTEERKLVTLENVGDVGFASRRTIRLNHYFVKSEADFARKINRCAAGCPIISRRQARLEMASLIETDLVEDRAIHRFLPLLYRAMDL